MNVVKINNERLRDIALKCHEKMSDADSSRQALRSIAGVVTAELGDFLRTDILSTPDELSINFIELLDQIIFETDDTTRSEGPSADYIFDNLYSRICVYLDVYKDIELYKKNFHGRTFFYDDTIIIKYLKLKNFIPDLLHEFSEHTGLKRQILKTLIIFHAECPVDFFYDTIKDINSTEVKLLSLVGLKLKSGIFERWDTLTGEYNGTIEFIRNFNTVNIEKNIIPDDLNSLIFSMMMFDHNLEKISEPEQIDWLFDVFAKANELNFDHHLSMLIHSTMTGILMFIRCDIINSYLKNRGSGMAKFVKGIESIPAEYFDRIMTRIQLLGDKFANNLNELIEKKKMRFEDNSNIIKYILWNSRNNS